MIALLTDGEVRHLQGYGAVDLRQGRKWSAAIRYSVGSITETLAASAILDLAAAGKLRLTDAITRYVPFLQPAARAVTIADLLAMSSGFWEVEELMEVAGETLIASPDDDISLSRDAVDAYASLQTILDHRPGAQYRHVSTNYRLLARVIEKVTGKSFATALEELVFSPAGMGSSAAIAARNAILPCSAMTYLSGNGHWRNMGAVALATSGDGAVVASMNDMVSWMRYMTVPQPAGGESRFVRQADLRNLIARPEAFYRVGLVLFRHAGYAAVGKADRTGSLYVHFPDLSLSLIIFNNRLEAQDAGTGHLRRLAAGIVDAYLVTLPRKQLPSALFARGATALPLMTQQLPPNAFSPGTYVSESTGEVLDIGVDGDRVSIELMGKSLDSWWRAGEVWHAAGPHAHVALRPDGQAAVARIELTEIDSRRTRSFVRVEERGLGAPVARAMAGWYFSEALQTYYRIGVADDAPYLAIKDDRRPGARRPLTQLAPRLFRAGDLFLSERSRTTNGVMGFVVSTARMRNVSFLRVAHE